MAKRKGGKIRIGVVGTRGGGQAFATAASALPGTELVAICGTSEGRLKEVGRRYGVATYTRFDDFLGHDMDGVVLANYFHAHAPLAIRALKAGFHVMSETAACANLAEGVALCRAVERTGKIYMFAETYPYNAANQQMRRVYQTGEVGRVLYAEGEYNQPFPQEVLLRYAPGLSHWRNSLPLCCYCTHALAPLMYAP